MLHEQHPLVTALPTDIGPEAGNSRRSWMSQLNSDRERVTCVCVRMYVRTDICIMHACTYSYVYMYVHACVHACKCVCVVCMWHVYA